MGYAASVKWVMSVCVHLRRLQARTLSRVVAAALSVDRTSIAKLGRVLSRQTFYQAVGSLDRQLSRRSW